MHQSRRPSGGGHVWPPLRQRPAAVPADLPAVRRADRAGAAAGADWPAVTGPTDCTLVSSWAGGALGCCSDEAETMDIAHQLPVEHTHTPVGQLAVGSLRQAA